MNRAELLLKRGKAITQARQLSDKYPDGTAIPGDVRQQIQALLDEAADCDKQLRALNEDAEFRKKIKEQYDSLNESEGREVDTADPAKESRNRKGDDKEARERKQKRQRQAFKLYLRHGVGGLNNEMREALGPVANIGDYLNEQRGVLNASGSDEADLEMEARALAAGTGSAGGFIVPPLFTPEVSQAMKAYQGVRIDGSDHIVGDSGADLPFPSNDDTGNTGEIVGENGSVSELDPVLANTVVSTFMYSSRLVRVPMQLLMDGGFDIVSWLFGILQERLGRITNTHWTNGTGTGQPRGLVTAMGTSGGGIGVSTAANNAFTADEVLALQHSVDPAYRDQSSYKMSDGILQRVRILKDGQGRYLLNDATAGAPATIWGKPFTIYTEMTATITPSTNIMLFGRTRDYKTREVRSLALFRFQEKYMDQHQVGFMAFQRFGGNYVNPGNNSVKALRTIA